MKEYVVRNIEYRVSANDKAVYLRAKNGSCEFPFNQAYRFGTYQEALTEALRDDSRQVCHVRYYVACPEAVEGPFYTRAAAEALQDILNETCRGPHKVKVRVKVVTKEVE